jgi:V/A-type H+-transporting ATPase subunit A
MLRLIIDYYELGLAALEKSAELDAVLNIPAREKIGRSKYIDEDNLAEFDQISKEVKAQLTGKL